MTHTAEIALAIPLGEQLADADARTKTPALAGLAALIPAAVEETRQRADQLATGGTHEHTDDNAQYLPDLKAECERRGLALQLTDDPDADLPEVMVIDGRLTCVARADELGIALDEIRLTYKAAAVFVANAAYTAALEEDDPAATLDNMCDSLPEIMPRVVSIVRTSPEFADWLRVDIADRLWAYTAIEHSRIEAGDGYGYLFDLLADDLRVGRDAKTVRTTALRVPGRIRALAEARG